MLMDFLTWWARQMAELLGLARLRRDAPGAALILAVDHMTGGETEVALIERRQGRGAGDRSLGRFALTASGLGGLAPALARRRAAPLVLRLPPAMLLERSVTLPLLAERAPEKVLQYEMDRFTPFASDELLWSWAIEARDRAHARLHIRLSFVPRAALAPLLTVLDGAGLALAGLEAPLPDGGWRRVSFHRGAGRGTRGLRLLGGLCATLALVAVGLPFVQQALAERDVARRQAALAPSVAQVERLRRDMAQRSAGIDVFAAERNRTGDALQAIAAITAILPDDTFLTELSLRQGKLGLAGQSAGAAKLITALSADRVIHNPAFAAPVTRVEEAGIRPADRRAEQFSIRAELAP